MNENLDGIAQRHGLSERGRHELEGIIRRFHQDAEWDRPGCNDGPGRDRKLARKNDGRDRDRNLARKVSRWAKELAAMQEILDLHGQSALPANLNDLSHSLQALHNVTMSGRKKRAHYRLEDDDLIRALACVYRDTGQRVALSRGEGKKGRRFGPFARFLMDVHAVLEQRARANSAEQLVRKAETVLEDLRQRAPRSAR